MSQIKNLVVEVEKSYHHSKALLKKQLSPLRYQVVWGGNPVGLSTEFYLSVINIQIWEPISLELHCMDGSRRIWLLYGTREQRWKRINRAFKLKEHQKAEKKQFGECSYYPIENIEEERKPKQHKEIMVGEHIAYHESVAEIVDRYDDPFNAVLIKPGSWVDKKLQEAYNSKRNLPGENVTDEPGTN